MTTHDLDPAEAERRLRAIIARIAKTDPDAFGPDDDLGATLGLDSLSALRIAAAVEREFDVRIPDAELHEVRSLGALRSLVTAGLDERPIIARECPPTPPLRPAN